MVNMILWFTIKIGSTLNNECFSIIDLKFFNLKWTLGFNFAINNDVHNLTDDIRKEIM